MRIELSPAAAPAPAWRPPEQALTLTFRPDATTQVDAGAPAAVTVPLCQVQVGQADRATLVITLA